MHKALSDKESKLLRQDFPVLAQHMHGMPLVYVDNAATTQQPLSVIESINNYMSTMHANVHRGVYELSARATTAFEQVRAQVAHFLKAPYVHECIFVRGTTEALNIVAHSYATNFLHSGDEILISTMEHHANIVPWQRVCALTGAILKVIPISDTGEILLPEFKLLLSNKTKIVAITHASNALGTVNPIREISALAHQVGAKVVVDGAQACPHMVVDVQDLGCDFYAFSAHKVYGPTGVGVLWGREELLNAMLPYQYGGEMIRQVSFTSTEYAPLPAKFEAGTPNIAGVIGLGAALNYLATLDITSMHSHENWLLNYATAALCALPRFRIIGTASVKVPVLSFVHESIHAHDIGTILDQAGIAIRSGHHCAMPLMDHLQVAATCRISFAFYNTVAEVERIVAALQQVEKVFGL